MIKKILIITLFLIFSYLSFGNQINFILNTKRGYIEYTNNETGEKFGLNFSQGRSTLDIPKGSYKFQFFSPNYHSKEVLVRVDNNIKSFNIDLEKKSSTFFISVIENRQQNIDISKEPINSSNTLTDSKIIFYKGELPVKSLNISSLLEPLNIDFGYYNISVIYEGSTIFKTEKFLINESDGRFINFLVSPRQVKVTGNLRIENMYLGGAKINFVDNKNNIYSLTTDFSGRFEGFIPARKYKVHVDTFGYKLNKNQDLLYDFDSGLSSYNLDLNLKELPSRISGRVVDSSNIPVTNAKVKLRLGKEHYETTTDNYGRFSKEVQSGIIFIKVSKKGYYHNGIVQKVDKYSSISNLEVILAQKVYSIDGVLTNGIQPLPNQRLDLYNKNGKKILSTLSGKNGYYEFLDVPATDKYYIRLASKEYDLFTSETIQLNKNLKNYNISLKPKKRKVILQVVDRNSNKLKDQNIVIESKEYKTDSNGIISFIPPKKRINIRFEKSEKSLIIKPSKDVYTIKF